MPSTCMASFSAASSIAAARCSKGTPAACSRRARVGLAEARTTRGAPGASRDPFTCENLTGQADQHAQSALRRIGQLDVAAVAEHDVARDGEAEADAAGAGAARGVETVERLERGFALVFRNARAVVIDGDPHLTVAGRRAHVHAGAVAGRVLHEVGEAPAHGDRAQRQRYRLLELDLDPGLWRGRAIGDLLQQRPELDRLDLLLPFAAREVEIAVDDAGHLLDVGA